MFWNQQPDLKFKNKTADAQLSRWKSSSPGADTFARVAHLKSHAG